MSSPNHSTRRLALILSVLALGGLPVVTRANDAPFVTGKLRPFLEEHCLDCHDSGTKKGGLDLENLGLDLGTAAQFDEWVKVHDKLRFGEMPPKKKPRPPQGDVDAVARWLQTELTATDQTRKEAQGRALFRRLTRTEYENTVRDLFDLPGLSVRELLPEDGRANGFDKVGEALDLSHVQLAKYLEAADAALDMAIATQPQPPEVYQARLRPSDQYDFMIGLGGGDVVPLKDKKPAPGLEILRDKPVKRLLSPDFADIDSAGVFRHEDCAFHPRFNKFAALYPGRYRVRISLWSYRWDKGSVLPDPQLEAASLTANGRLLGYFDAPSLEPKVHEVETWLNRGEFLNFNAASLWHVRVSEKPGRAAEYVGPGIAVDWLEVEGPLTDQWPPVSHRRLFGELPLAPWPKDSTVRPPRRVPVKQALPGAQQPPKAKPEDPKFWTVASVHPRADAQRLLTDFLRRAFRRPVEKDEVERYVALAMSRMDVSCSFEEAMRTAYKAALCSPDFLFLRETPGKLDDWALATRLSYFLWNSLPDDDLTKLAQDNKLHDARTLKTQVERLLASPKAERFIADFLDQWLDLREFDATTPDTKLYPEFTPYLHDAMKAESRAFFREMLAQNLGVRNIVDSEFVMLNQKLAEHYEIPGVTGAEFRRVALPPGSHRGGFLTQGGICKITANGTVTSPVKRGAWVLRKITGQPPSPPPPDILSIEPDVRGTTTVREMLDKHRNSETCAACHSRMDPPGFALENYDVIGGWRQRFRSIGEGDEPDPVETGGHKVGYKLALTVDAAGQLPDGRAFSSMDEFRKLLLTDERLLAANLTRQLLTYATGAPVGFSDRPVVEQILNRTQGSQFGVRNLITEVVLSPTFQSK